MPELPVRSWWGDDVVEVTEGVLDAEAEDAYQHGHCHALALALCELIPEAELVGVWEEDEEDPIHVLVQVGSQFLDITGFHPESELLMYGDRIEPMQEEDVWALVEADLYYEPDLALAETFAKALLEKEEVHVGA